jgi:hypothetical protein
VPLVFHDCDTEEVERWLYRDYAMLARYGHQPLSEAARLTTRQRRAMIDALMGLIDEENESARLATSERD